MLPRGSHPLGPSGCSGNPIGQGGVNGPPTHEDRESGERETKREAQMSNHKKIEKERERESGGADEPTREKRKWGRSSSYVPLI